MPPIVSLRMSTERSSNSAGGERRLTEPVVMKEQEGLGGPVTRRTFVGTASAAALAPQLAVQAPAATLTAADAFSLREQALTLNVNGTDRALTVEPRVTLLDALRDRLGLTGTKKGCDQGTCGACTVLVNGRRIDSCLSLAVMHSADRIVTIEGLAQAGKLHPVQAAFIEHDAFQCGYCTPGQILSAVGMLQEGHRLDRSTVREQMSGNICRCGCYPHIIDAVLQAAGSS
jgi:xanthine dehydrogenase YagT iron-sulfur-binding subunit